MQPKTGPASPFCGGTGPQAPSAGRFPALLGLAALLTGCSGPKPSPPAPEPGPTKAVLRIACPGDPAAAVVRGKGRAWAYRTQTELEVVRYDPGAGPQAGPADAWVIPPAELARWVTAGRLHPVPAAYTAPDGDYNWNNLLPLYRSKLLVWAGQAYALPLLGDARLCFYREDLFANPDHRAAYQKQFGRQLGPPATWEEFADLAEFFHRRTGKPSLPPLPDEPAELDQEFFAVAAPFARRAIGEGEWQKKRPPEDEAFAFHYDWTTGQPRIDTPGFMHALALLRRLQKNRPPGEGRPPAETFRAGRAVLCLASPAWIARFQETGSAAAGKFGFVRVPGSGQFFDYRTGQARPAPGGNFVPYLGAGGWLAVVPKSNAQPERTFELLAELSGPKTSLAIVVDPAWGGGVLRRSHFEQREPWFRFNLKAGPTNELMAALRQTLSPALVNPVLCLRTPDAREHQLALLEEIRAALTGATDPAPALAAAARRWRQLDRAKDAQMRRAEYRISLGLEP